MSVLEVRTIGESASCDKEHLIGCNWLRCAPGACRRVSTCGDLPYFREEQTVEKMGHLLRDVCIPADVAKSIEAALQRHHVDTRAQLSSERSRLEHTLQTLHRHVDAAYTDKLEVRSPRNSSSANRPSGSKKNGRSKDRFPRWKRLKEQIHCWTRVDF
jgi:hypothetical protein